jgi:hypothetical protein
MIKDDKLYIGGNKFYFWLGKVFKKWSDRLTERGKVKIVTNPSAKIVNPYTVIIMFLVDGVNKYQLILEGDFKEKYKNSEDGSIDIGEQELLLTINSMRKNWFKRD